MEDNYNPSEEKYRILVEGIKDYAIFMLDSQGMIKTWNEGAYWLSGFTAEETIGEHFSILYSLKEQNSGFIQDSLNIAIRYGCFEREGWRQKKNGKDFWADEVISPMYDAHDQLMGFSNIVKDCTAGKEARDQLEEAKERAEEANKKKSQFLANMSHELRTPLNAVIGYADMLKKGIVGRLNTKQEQFISSISLSGKHLLEMVNDILDLSKVEAGKMSLKIEYLQLIPLLQELIEMTKINAKKKNIILTLDIQEGLDGVDADATRLKQILFNLISNAIKFNKNNGKVHISFYKTQDRQWIICRVLDTGIGIPNQKIGELFSHFYQVDSTAARVHEGTGLGLALVKQLVELHGGMLEVESQEGLGSTFTFKLPTQKP